MFQSVSFLFNATPMFDFLSLAYLVKTILRKRRLGNCIMYISYIAIFIDYKWVKVLYLISLTLREHSHYMLLLSV